MSPMCSLCISCSFLVRPFFNGHSTVMDSCCSLPAYSISWTFLCIVSYHYKTITLPSPFPSPLSVGYLNIAPGLLHSPGTVAIQSGAVWDFIPLSDFSVILYIYICSVPKSPSLVSSSSFPLSLAPSPAYDPSSQESRYVSLIARSNDSISAELCDTDRSVASMALLSGRDSLGTYCGLRDWTEISNPVVSDLSHEKNRFENPVF